jgi:hypothetical protein
MVKIRKFKTSVLNMKFWDNGKIHRFYGGIFQTDSKKIAEKVSMFNLVTEITEKPTVKKPTVKKPIALKEGLLKKEDNENE